MGISGLYLTLAFCNSEVLTLWGESQLGTLLKQMIAPRKLPIQLVWGGPKNLYFLTSSQVTSMLQAQSSHLGNHYCSLGP